MPIAGTSIGSWNRACSGCKNVQSGAIGCRQEAASLNEDGDTEPVLGLDRGRLSP